MIGFKFPENFNNHYTSQSITEFWRRWHITLGAWMRNYLYIPLGGNRVKTNRRLYFNLWFVFLASGLWHGASWSFVIWGAYHGLFLVLERIFLADIYRRIGKLSSTIITFLIVVVGWVFFRIEELPEAGTFLSRMFAFDFNQAVHFTSEFYTYLIIAAVFAFFTYSKKGKRIQDLVYSEPYSMNRYISVAAFSLIALMFSVSSITSSGFNPFIYFRF